MSRPKYIRQTMNHYIANQIWLLRVIVMIYFFFKLREPYFLFFSNPIPMSKSRCFFILIYISDMCTIHPHTNMWQFVDAFYPVIGLTFVYTWSCGHIVILPFGHVMILRPYWGQNNAQDGRLLKTIYKLKRIKLIGPLCNEYENKKTILGAVHIFS